MMRRRERRRSRQRSRVELRKCKWRAVPWERLRTRPHPIRRWFFYFAQRVVDRVIVVIDNYDSFTFNLVQYMLMAGVEVNVHRNDQVSVDDVLAANPSGIVLSPGPCTPFQAGISLDLVRRAAGIVPMLGVCLGHQTIGQAFGGEVVRADEVMHGKVSMIEQDRGSVIFAGLPRRFLVTRYHSLIVREPLPASLKVTARTESGMVMALEHIEHPIYGVQFHPEAVLTEYGHEMVRNFLRVAGDLKDQSAVQREPAVRRSTVDLESCVGEAQNA